MRVPYVALDAYDAARALGPQQWVARLMMLFGTVVVLGAASGAGAGLGTLGLVGVLGLGGWAAMEPDSVRPAVLVTALALLWWIRADDAPLTWSPAAAMGVLLVHTGAAIAAETPPGGRLSTATQRRWLIHGVVVAAVAMLVWGMASLFSGADADGQAVATGAALVGVVITVALLSWRADAWTDVSG